MNKKILAIGSITTCIILLVAGLSPVVGYNSARSGGKDSPLFSIRTKRAIDQESEGLTCEYVGKGDTLFIPPQQHKTIILQKVRDIISRLDYETFTRVVDSYKEKLNQLKAHKDIEKSNLPTLNGAWRPGCLLWYFYLIIETGFLIMLEILAMILGPILDKLYPTWYTC